MPLVIPLLAVGALYAAIRGRAPSEQTEQTDPGSTDTDTVSTDTVSTDTSTTMPSGAADGAADWPIKSVTACDQGVLSRWIERESGWNPCSVGAHGPLVWEVGLGQIYLETPTANAYGASMAMRDYCGSGSTVVELQRITRELTPAERQLQIDSAAAQCAHYYAAATSYLASSGLAWSAPDVYCLGKMAFDLPTLATRFLTAAVSADSAADWDSYRGYLESLSRDTIVAIDPVMISYSSPMTRYTSQAQYIGRGA